MGSQKLALLLLSVALGWAQLPSLISPADERLMDAYRLLNDKNYSAAERQFSQLARDFPNDVRGPAGLAEVRLAQNDRNGAVEAVRQAADKHPADTQFRQLLAQTLVRARKFADGIYEYERLLKTAGTPQAAADLYAQMGDAQRQARRVEDAIASFEKAKQLSRGSPRITLAFALMLDNAGLHDRAADEYEEVIAKEPDNALALNNRAYDLAGTGAMPERALEYALRANAVRPGVPEYIDTLGWVYLKQGKPDLAFARFKEAFFLERDGDDPAYRSHMAAALTARGKLTDEEKQLRALLWEEFSPETDMKIRDMLGLR